MFLVAGTWTLAYTLGAQVHAVGDGHEARAHGEMWCLLFNLCLTLPCAVLAGGTWVIPPRRPFTGLGEKWIVAGAAIVAVGLGHHLGWPN